MADKKPQNRADPKHQIQIQLADLSRLLGQMSNEDTIVNDARTSFLNLATFISRTLDIQLQ
mgnify:CR=1 FL=1